MFQYSQSKGEIDEKIQLYLARGAIEVWIVDEAGSMSYYSNEGQILDSTEVQAKS